MQPNKTVIIVGGGESVREGINQGLWDRIKGKEIWSCNSVYKAMPYLPKKQIWVDREFFNHEVDNLQRLHDQGVELYTKKSIQVAGLAEMITQYDTHRERQEYHGRLAVARGMIYYGAMGLCGQFALSLAVGLGYQTIYILGYDFGAPSIDKKSTHWYQDRISELQIHSSGAGRPEVYLHKEPAALGKVRADVDDFSVYLAEADLKIYNVSMVSHIPFYEKITYPEMFEKLGVN